MFYPTEYFPFTRTLEQHWQTVLDELLALPDTRFMPWPETFLYEAGWDVFGLYASGKRIADNCALCPETTQLVETIPGLVTAGFSSLKPMTRIKPHVGYAYSYSANGEVRSDGALNRDVLRCHLGLIVPKAYTENGCALRVADQTHPWTQGECFVFDDTVVHEAWNLTFMTRVVLLLDFRKAAFANVLGR